MILMTYEEYIDLLRFQSPSHRTNVQLSRPLGRAVCYNILLEQQLRCDTHLCLSNTFR
jgi:hypothetical protein